MIGLYKVAMMTALFITSWLSREHALDDRDYKLTRAIVRAAFEEAPKYEIDPLLLLAIGEVESTWSPYAGCRSDQVGCGVYQQVPVSSRRWVDECWDGPTYISGCIADRGSHISRERLQDPMFATIVALRHLSYLMDRFSLNESLRAYNRGVGRRNDAMGFCYEQKVLRVYNRLYQAAHGVPYFGYNPSQYNCLTTARNRGAVEPPTTL